MDVQAEFPTPDQPSGPAACPLCRGEVHPAAIVCEHCGGRLSHFKICPRCAEQVHEDAQLCRFCQYDFDREAERQKLLRALEANPHCLTANPLGVLFTEMSITGLFFPPELEIRGGDVVLRRWSLFGLRRLDQRIPIRRIASARMLTGVIWGGLMIETFGGALSDLVMHGLDREQAAETAALLERITVKD
jgi:hypothetical protein